jgi:hypothetical protein
MVDSQRLLRADDLQATDTQFLERVVHTQLFIANQVSSPMLSNDSGDYPSVRNRGSVEERSS